MKDFLIAFSAMDKDDDGLVSLPEFRLAMQRLDLGLTIDQLALLFENLDENSDGVIKYSEFLGALESCDGQSVKALQQSVKGTRQTLGEIRGRSSHEQTADVVGTAKPKMQDTTATAKEDLLRQVAAAEESRSILATEVASKNSQIAYLNQLVDQLQARHPDIGDAVQAALKQQEAVMESRSQKVLSILRAKDEQIACKFS